MSKRIEDLFDLMCFRAANPGGVDYTFESTGKTLNAIEQERFIKKTAQFFMHNVGQVLGENKTIQAFTGSSDLPALTKSVFNVTNEVPNYDLLWANAFRGVKLRKGELDWEIATVGHGFSFEEIPEGGKVKFKEYTGEKISAKIKKYGLGVGVTWETIEGRKLYQFIEQMDHTRSELYALWANIHYGLLAAAAAADTSAKAQAESFAADYLRVPWQGIVGDSDLDRDIKTINTAYERLGNILKNRGYGDTANAPIIAYFKPTLKSRILRALRAVNVDNKTSAGAGSSAGQSVVYNVTPYFSWNAAIPDNKGIFLLPGQKIQNAVYLQELGLSKQDIESLNELRTYWTAFGAIVADADQVSEVAFS